MQQDPKPSQSSMPPEIDQIFGEAENTLKQGMQTLNEWGNQARRILKDKPGVVIASVSIAGFMTGLLLRQRRLFTQTPSKPMADPMVMFIAGAVAGFAMGPKIFKAGEEESAPPAHTPLP